MAQNPGGRNGVHWVYHISISHFCRPDFESKSGTKIMILLKFELFWNAFAPLLCYLCSIFDYLRSACEQITNRSYCFFPFQSFAAAPRTPKKTRGLPSFLDVFGNFIFFVPIILKCFKIFPNHFKISNTFFKNQLLPNSGIEKTLR